MISVSALSILVSLALIVSSGAIVLLIALAIADIRKEELW